jgi:hypothetical protein
MVDCENMKIQIHKNIFFQKKIVCLVNVEANLDYGNHTTLFHTSYTNHGEINIVIF